MAKVIAFYGAPGSGKTSLAVKTAIETYCSLKNGTVLYISAALETPAMGLLFPNFNPEDIYSLTGIFDGTGISRETILKNGVMTKNMRDFVFLGFKSGDTKYSFPSPNEAIIEELFNAMQDTAEYIFVDCTSEENDLVSQKAILNADIAFRIIQPDPKGMAWLSSHKGTNRQEGENLFNIINITESKLYSPTEEVCTHLNSIAALIPYSALLRQQMLDGKLYEPVKDNAFHKKIKKITEIIIKQEDS